MAYRASSRVEQWQQTNERNASQKDYISLAVCCDGSAAVAASCSELGTIISTSNMYYVGGIGLEIGNNKLRKRRQN